MFRRFEVDAGRYSFIVPDFHRLLPGAPPLLP